MNFIRNGDPVGPLDGYSCQIVVDEALRWLEATKDSPKPFFMNIWFHEPHAPIAAPQELVQRYGKTNDRAAVYSATIENTDQAIGRLLTALDRSGLRDQTLVIYASDNGSYRDDRTGGLRGRKGQNWEGGIRVPGIFSWPGEIASNQTSREPCGLVDVLPTVCGLLGINPPDVHLDGTDLTPILRERPGDFHRNQPMFWHLQKSRPIVALREGNYSLVADPAYELSTSNLFDESWIPKIKSGDYHNFRLYDLESDPVQQVDISGTRPDVFERLKASLLAINASIMQDGADWHLDSSSRSSKSVR